VFRRRLVGFAVLALLVMAAPASATDPVLQTYEEHGVVPACEFTSQQLEQALKQSTYGAQYFNDFTSAVQAALQARAAGACSSGQLRQRSADRAGLALPPRLASITAATGAGIPLPMLLLAVFAVLALLGGAVVAVVRWRAWDPGWAAAWRHMWSETGDRGKSVWSEFTDWIRSGSR
jgi:hypothetical protein